MENNSNSNTPNTPNNGNKQKMFRFNFYWMYGLILVMLVALYMSNDTTSTKELGWTEFQKLTKDNAFEEMVVFNKKNVVEATVKSNKVAEVFTDNMPQPGTVAPKVYIKIPSADKFSDFYDQAVTQNHIDTQVRFEESDDAVWSFIISFGPMILLLLVWIFLMQCVLRRKSQSANLRQGQYDQSDLQGCSRTGRSQTGGRRNCLVPEESCQVHRIRRQNPQGCLAGRPSGNG